MLKTVGFPSTRTGDQTVVDGNLIIGTSGKGIDFSVNPNPAGMTSELLNDYEEGTFTPIFVGLTGVSGPTDSNGSYTKIGRIVYFRIYIFSGFTTSVAGSTYCNNLPFTASGNHVCAASSATSVADFGTGLIQNARAFTPSWTNQQLVVITGTYTV